jgi:hypothetical protein
MSSDIPIDPIARKLADASARAKEEEDAASGAALLNTEFSAAARRAAPTQFETMAAILRARGDAINNGKPSDFPELKYVAVNHRLDAGKFAIELQPLESLRDYTVTVTIGLHPNAHLFLSTPLKVESIIATFRAGMDETGAFFWIDTGNGGRQSAGQIIDHALKILSDLLIADHAGKLNAEEFDF